MILIDAPSELDEDMIASLKISVVAAAVDHEDTAYYGEVDPFAYPVARKMGIYESISGKEHLQITKVLDRIMTNRSQYETKFTNKLKKEQEYWANRRDEEHKALVDTLDSPAVKKYASVG